MVASAQTTPPSAATANQQDEEDSEAEDAHADADASQKAPLSWLMSRLSFVARNLIISRPSGHEQIRSPVSAAKVIRVACGT